jgi:hypothetical protein
VRTYEGGNIQSQGTTGARFRAADFGDGMGQAIQQAGKVVGDVADKIDQVEDVKARVEANRLAVEHSEHVREINRRVVETLGEGAEAASDQGVIDLQATTKDLIGRASPRARLLLQNELTTRSGAAMDSWHTHGFRQKGEALESSSVARINRVVEDAADLEDEGQATAMLGEIRGINEQRANFFGKGKDWLLDEDRKAVSTFYKSRALKLATGESGSASAAIGYAEKNRDKMTDADYLALVTSYNDSALDETATAMVYGASPVGAAVVEGEAPADGGPPPAALDPIAFFKAFVSPHEGAGLVVDSNGALVKYGVNAAYNPGEDIRGMTEDRAAEVFRTKYFIPSGADKLPPGLAAIHADTYWLNQKQAMKILKDSGGDPDKYIEMRGAFLNSLIAKNPAKYGQYRNGWERRTKELAAYADRQGGDGTSTGPIPVGPNTSLEGFRAQVMARTDIGMNLKTKIIKLAEGRRAEVRQEQQIYEEQVTDQLTAASVALGEGFTDVKQLPSNIWVNAPPSVQAKFIAQAKTNKEAKPLSPAAAAQVGFLRSFKPESFTDPKMQRELAKMGLTTKQISDLAAEGGKAAGTIAGQKADPIPRSTLESLARPAYEAAGYRLWTTEAPDKQKDKSAAEKRQDAAQQIQLLNNLEHEAVAWANANPGKKADTTTMQKWIANSLIRTLPDRPFGTLNDHEVINSYGQKNYTETAMLLRSHKIDPTPANIADYLRRYFRRQHGGQ